MYVNPKSIAILMATYNAEKYITQQIDSIIGQTNNDWVLYIRDDGSKDATVSILEQYAQEYTNIVIIKDTKGNLGCRDNFFELLLLIDSAYYMFCDQDDVWLPKKVEVSLAKISDMEARYGNCMPLQAFCDDVVCDEYLNVIEQSRWRSSRANRGTMTQYNYIAISCNVSGANSIFNHKVKYLIFPLKNETLMYDYWIALEVAKYGKIEIIDHPLRLYRIHRNQTLSIAVGSENSLSHKLSKIGQLLKQYYLNAKLLKSVGYGPHIKYYWYKMMMTIKARF